MSEQNTIWTLSARGAERFRKGHPWVFSNELKESPKGLEPGAPVEVRDAGGKFLARGYGNPRSLIAFRTLSRDPDLLNPEVSDELVRRLVQARDLRTAIGLSDTSHRWVFSEADRLPGWILDRYVTPQGFVLVLQVSTAGLERKDEELIEILERATGDAAIWKQSTVIVDRSSRSREFEGLPLVEPQVLKKGTAFQPVSEIIVRGVPFRVDFIGGQKTGFFLDQADNVSSLAQRLEKRASRGPVKVLDLCTYVGQWGVQLGRAIARSGGQPHVVAVDASAQALERAGENLSRSEIPHELLKLDVLKELGDLPTQGFDVVIADPPALIQGRKHVHAGQHAYLQLNTEAFRLVRAGGLLVSCSCSGLLERDNFEAVLSKAAFRNRRDVRFVEWGGQAGDHPVLMEFPEGRYLKSGVAWVL